MGVHGLTTFIARYHDKHKQKIYLHDCPIVIDGCNLMYFLYFEGRHSLPSAVNGPSRKSGGGGSPLSNPSPLRSPHLFGGDYITYAQNVREFFQHLKHCNITPVVLFDGAYDALKIKTAFKRFAENLKENVRGGGGSLKGVTPGSTYSPVFIKAVFVEILQEQKVPHYQTEHEADCTIAFIARKLGNCPILSSDSDFHMYVNAVVLPLPTLRFKKVTPKEGTLLQADTPSSPASPGSPSTPGSAKLWTLHSQYVSLANLCQKEFNLCDTRLLPIAAVILGNDWIQTGTFSRFHSTTAGGAKVNRAARIAYLLKWLGKQKSYTKVLNAMLSTVKETQRERITQLVNEIVAIYEGMGGEDKVWAKILETGGIDKFITEENTSVESDTVIQDLMDKLSLESNPTPAEDLDLVQQDVSLNLENCEDVSDEEGEDLDDSDSEELDIRNREENTKIELTKVPDWYLDSHISCSFPTYLLKLIRNRMVFLSPQIETSSMPSSHTMSIPIIQVLGGILLGDEQTLTLVTRQKAQIMKDEVKTIGKLPYYGTLPQFNQETLNLKKLLSSSERTQIILETMGLHDPELRFENFINEWPMSLRIWIISLLYFLRKSKNDNSKDKNDATKHAEKTAIPVAIGILMSVIKNALLNSSPLSGNSAETSREEAKISELLVQTNALNLSKLRQFYTKLEIMPDVSSRNFTRSYDIGRAYNLSQFTCILFHVNQLNRLLGDPFRAPRLSYNLNNWFVYNFSGKMTMESGDFDGQELEDFASFVGQEVLEDMGIIVRRLLSLREL